MLLTDFVFLDIFSRLSQSRCTTRIRRKDQRVRNRASFGMVSSTGHLQSSCQCQQLYNPYISTSKVSFPLGYWMVSHALWAEQHHRGVGTGNTNVRVFPRIIAHNVISSCFHLILSPITFQDCMATLRRPASQRCLCYAQSRCRVSNGRSPLRSRS